MDRFSQLLRSVSRDCPQSEGDNLLGFRIDLDVYSERLDALEHIRVEETSDPENMIVLLAEASNSVQSLSDLKSSMSSLWLDIAYRDIQASLIKTYLDRCVLRFVTAIEPSVLFVSGSFCVTGLRYERLAKDHEKNWNSRLRASGIDA